MTALRDALERYRRAYLAVHSSYDGECEHGFGPPATKCTNDDCPDREMALAWNDLAALASPAPDEYRYDSPCREALAEGAVPGMRYAAHRLRALGDERTASWLFRDADKIEALARGEAAPR